jgi:hypothetical protein
LLDWKAAQVSELVNVKEVPLHATEALGGEKL